MMVFVLICNTFGRKFSFNAENMGQAVSKAKGWCLHHGFCYREEFSVEGVDETNPNDLHNEWVN